MCSRTTPGRDQALFRLAESQRLMGNSAAAESSFQRIAEESGKNPFAPAAAFRLGELREQRGFSDDAASAFELAANGTADQAVRQEALYREALCFVTAGKKDHASTLLKELAEQPGESPHRIPALLQLSSLATQEGARDQALAWYDRILAPGSHAFGEVLSEATFKAAILHSELGHSTEAQGLFEKVANSKGAGRWRDPAALGAIRTASQAGQNDDVVRIAEKALAEDSVNRPEILLLRANALRKLGKNPRALEDYDAVIREYPESKPAAAAPLQRLLSLYALRNASLPEEIDHYLLLASDPGDRATAQLLKAEETMRRGKFKEAAALYHNIAVELLPEGLRADIHYKEAWALIQAGDKGAALVGLDRFLELHPDEERSPAALAQRALLKQQQKDFPGALADYDHLLERYPKAAEKELALQQKALLLGQQQDNKGMSETFSLLLQEYPKSPAAAQAHYWIGWTAFENKDYATVVDQLSMARDADPTQFAERAGLRILLARYYQNDAEGAAREAAALKPNLIPPEAGRWLGLKAMENGNASKAERFLSPLVREGLPGASDPEIQGTLASALVAQGKDREAQAPAATCLKLARDPASRAKALLVAAAIQQSIKNLAAASSMVDEAMLLQPEGPINTEARILSGDLLTTRQDHAAAAKAYMTAALLYDDPTLTPKALVRAVNAYRQSGNMDEGRKTLEELRKRFPNTPLPSPPRS